MSDGKTLRVRIAEARGWSGIRLDKHSGRLVATHADDVALAYLPAYGTTWADTGPLFEEMALSPQIDRMRFDSDAETVMLIFYALILGTWRLMDGKGPTLCAAIGEAWLVWEAAQR